MLAKKSVRTIIATTAVVMMCFPSTSSVRQANAARLAIPQRIHNLYVIGDSLTYGSNAFAGFSRKVNESRLWKSAQVDARVGRSTMTGVRIIQKAKLKKDTAILVALGTNDMMSRRERWYPAYIIDQFMKAAKGKPVLWLNLEYSTTRPDWYRRGIRFNRELERATQRWSNLTVADWDEFFTPKKKNRFSRDGVHLNVSAYRLRSTFMLKQLAQWSTDLYNKTTTTTTTTTQPSIEETAPPQEQPPQAPDENPAEPTPPEPDPSQTDPQIEPAPAN